MGRGTRFRVHLGIPEGSLWGCSQGVRFVGYCTVVLQFRGCRGSALGALERFLSQRNASSRRSRPAAPRKPSARALLSWVRQTTSSVLSPITAAQRTPCEPSPRAGESSLKELPLHSPQVLLLVCLMFGVYGSLHLALEPRAGVVAKPSVRMRGGSLRGG